MRKIIVGMQVTLDGYIEGPNGELDWAMAEDEEAWSDVFETLTRTDALILGRVMYPAYEQYWLAVLADPTRMLPFSGRTPTKNEIAYARRADNIPHLVLSKTLDKAAWKTTRIVRDVEEIRKMKQPGKDMLVLGGAILVSSLMNLGLIDELQLTVNPLVLGGGKPLFKDVKERHTLKLVKTKTYQSGKVALHYERGK